ncbi:MAG: hypothetical protein H0T53_10635 [Herpetosiphonaceae bacterium]|nr:hypothetical protein [Herpetosiphonaceae bacterium]
MRFPKLEQVALPATFVALNPGRLHPDGSRYLPLIVLRLTGGTHLGVVDRHHRVDPARAGTAGIVRLIFQLSRIKLQPPGQRRCGMAVPPHEQLGISVMPAACGQIVSVLTWEQHRKLDYASLYTELLIDIGDGTVGLRTTVTGADLTAVIGAEQLQAGDWIELTNSRIDILEFSTQ